MGSWVFSFGLHSSDPLPFEKIIERLSDAGYDEIEIRGFAPHVTLDKYWTADSRIELTELLRNWKL